MTQSAYWDEVNETIARELGWKFEPGIKPACWKAPTGLYFAKFPDYIGSLQACEEIFDYCAAKSINVIIYFNTLGYRRRVWMCSMFAKEGAARAESDLCRLALGKAFLDLRRQRFDDEIAVWKQ